MKLENYQEVYNRWLETEISTNLATELRQLREDEIKERFYKYLEFGTGGIRGELGVGTNRMNQYTIRRATQGLSQFIQRQGEDAMKRGVVIAYDSRHFSQEFALEAACTLAQNGITSYVFSDLRPTPELSFAVRELHAIAGIVITASHNPPQYNGYKVYWEDGGQIPPTIADAITSEILQITNELELPIMDQELAIQAGLLSYIDKDIDDSYQNHLEKLVLNPESIHKMGQKLNIVYTPLHGTGNLPVRKILKRAGFANVLVVPEQELPDPNFSTVASPNPEEREAFHLAIELAKQQQADLILGTDPDTDRVGAVVLDHSGEYVVLTGNQTGALLLDYILSQRQSKGILPSNGVVLKTIVTSEMGRKVALQYGIETIDTLTGFKYIGEKIKEYEESGEKQFLFGYEESYGYLIRDFVRDKDAVQACLMISEMTAYYKSIGLTLYDALMKLYEKVGYYQEDLISITLKGIHGIEKMKHIMSTIREHPPQNIGNYQVKTISDYLLNKKEDLLSQQIQSTGLPKSDVIHITLEDDSWFAIRPSGTEPKLKIYFSVVDRSLIETKEKLNTIREQVLRLLDTEA